MADHSPEVFDTEEEEGSLDYENVEEEPEEEPRRNKKKPKIAVVLPKRKMIMRTMTLGIAYVEK